MKKSKLFTLLGVGLLSLGIGVAAVTTVDAVETPTYAKATDVWSITGTMTGWNPASTDYDMIHTSDDENGNYVWTIDINLTTNDQFKIVKNHAWGGDIGWNASSTDQGKSDYLKNAGGNFGVKVAGFYTITFTDLSVKNASYGPWAGNVAIAPKSAEKYTIIYHSDEVVTEEVNENTVWNSKFIEKEGYRLEGWYTDAELTTEFVKGTHITTDVDLYPKYVEAEDYRVLIAENHFGIDAAKTPAMYAYMWRGKLDGGNNNWPGQALKEIEKFDNYYVLTIDASKSFDSMILSAQASGISGDKYQTVDLELTLEDLVVYQVEYDATNNKKQCIIGQNEFSLAFKIFELGGAWGENTDERTPNCESNYATAKAMYETLNEGSKTAFQTSTNTVVAQARERYVNWCSANGDNAPYGEQTVGLNALLNMNGNNVSNIVAISLIILAVSLTIVIVIKRKREIQK